MNTSHKTNDFISDIIFSTGLRIESLLIHEKRLLFFLNSKQVLIDSIDHHERLKNATISQLKEYRLISQGMGIHWPTLDEDLSLHGLLNDYFTKIFHDQRELVIA
jgi:hypothetical protein